MLTDQTETGAESALAAVDPEILDLAAHFEAELERAVKGPGWDLPTWFLGKLAEVDALRVALREHYQELLAAIDNREKALHWKLGARFKLAVEQDLRKQNQGKGKPKKSVTYLTGKAGVRSSVPTLKITDEPALRAWCLEHLETALELRIKGVTPIKEHVKATGEVPPGAAWTEAEDRFYPALDLAELANKGEAPGLTAGAEGGAS